MNRLGIGTSRWHWFMRGAMIAILVIGSLNALSFFYWSQGWGSLLGTKVPDDEAIGFPALVWREGGGYGSHDVRWFGWGINLLTTMLFALGLGGVAMRASPQFNRIIEMVDSQLSNDPPHPIQFSMRGIFVAMVLAAVIAAIGRSLKPSWEILASIYLLSPLGLVLLALLPHRIAWQHRCLILAPAALAIIGVAIFIGSRIGVDFDKVLMGIFICWTPQSALGAIGLLVVLFVSQTRKLARP